MDDSGGHNPPSSSAADPAAAAADPNSQGTDPKPPTFWVVQHKFKDFKHAQKWWAATWEFFDTPGAPEAVAAQQQALGFANVFFLPGGLDKTMYCVWESKFDVSEEEFQSFIDGEDGAPSPAAGLTNKVYKSNGAGMMPPTAFLSTATPVEAVTAWLSKLFGKAKPAGPAQSTGSWFLVHHTFRRGEAEPFWERIGAMAPEDWVAMTERFNELGFHNHFFNPTTDPSTVFCLWECKDDISERDFQKFIDGPDGPGPGVFRNDCLKVAPGAVLPEAKFAQ